MKVQVNQVDKKARLTRAQVIRYQLMTHCFLNGIIMSDADLDCLTFLGESGEFDLSDFCEVQAEIRLKERLKTWKPDPHDPNKRKPEASPQTIRNIVIRAEKSGLITKKGDRRKKIKLNPDLKIQTKGNILLDFKFVSLEPEKVEGTNT